MGRKVDDAGGRPDEGVASDIATKFCGRRPQYLRRFATGIGHWVYDVQDPTGEKFVVRVGSQDQVQDFLGAVHWSRSLRPIGVPLPALLATGEYKQFPYVVLERIPGEDLGLVYASLAAERKKTLAIQIFGIQRVVASLGEGPGFGYVRLPSATCRPTWRHVVDDSIGRSLARMASTSSLNRGAVERVSASAARFDPYFSRVRPTPFLDDTTTKNVLVHHGALAGIVDVDWICFGDPLLTVGLTRASLLCAGQDLAYPDYWYELFEPSEERRAALRFYTGLFLLDFMSEIGQRFNRDAAPFNEHEVQRLEVLLEEQLYGL